MRIDEFDGLDQEAARQAIRPALDVPRWVDEIVEIAEAHDYACPAYHPRKAGE